VALDAGEVPVGRFWELVSRDPAFGDLVLCAYLLRRSILIGLGVGLIGRADARSPFRVRGVPSCP
jgi:thioredoxin reductase (NADPH)